MGLAVGIDLGTTNSVISVMRKGVIETINIDGRASLPSVVSFRSDNSMLVGQPAKARIMLDPANTVSSAKRYMGNRAKLYQVGGKTLTPVDIASIVLTKLADGASKGLGEKVRDVVITVPAYFNEAQKEDTKRAGERAGLNVLRLLPEPTAAAIAYGLDKDKDQTLMVYDLGGGTFDISVLTVKGNKFNVLAVDGDSCLGGDDFDEAVVRWACAQYEAAYGTNILQNKSQDGRAALQKLREAAEVAKMELAESDQASISIPDCLGKPFDVEIGLSEYNSLIEPFLKRTIAHMRSALRDAELRPEDIDRVVLVGGSTKNRAVRDLVAREIKDPYTASRVDEAVSHGAAIVAANMSVPDDITVPIEVTDVTAHSLGIDMLNTDEGVIFQPIIARQTAYPCRRARLGSTSYPMQDGVAMTVFRGESRNPSENERLGELELPIIPPQDDLVPIAAIFELDANGMIHFTAVQLPISAESQYVLADANNNSGSLSENGIKLLTALIDRGIAMARTAEVKT